MSSINIKISLSIKEMAITFCDMDCDKQAEFFNQISENVAASWRASFKEQVEFIHSSPVLTLEGLEIMKQLGNQND
jgi:hypothetical protein